MNSQLPQYTVRNLLLSISKTQQTHSSLLTRSIVSCRHRPSSVNAWKLSSSRSQWNRQLSTSAVCRAVDRPPKDGSEASSVKQEKKDETFYMPPPPQYQNPTQNEGQKSAEDVKETVDAGAVPTESSAPTESSIPPMPEREIPEVKDEPASTTQRTDPELRPETESYEQLAKESASQEAATQEPLPSQRQEQRWQLSKRLQSRMDELLAKAAFVSHQVNNYTGTDYSGIERLRNEIIEQEQLVKSAHAAVAAAKDAYTTSYSQQAASQKEVVGLLERKHSWSAADLERYMSLIRSEHLNEQAVQAAKDQLSDAERHLEDARSKLEKKERKQYHEEQIWSDTIRRNSTWVTFGLMGLNIFLLLVNLVIIEPWRRRRMVREIRSALDEKTTIAPAVSAVEAEVDQNVEPVAQPLEKLEEQVVETVRAVTPEAADETVAEVTAEKQPETVADDAAVGETALATGEVLPQEAVDIIEPTPEVATTVEEAESRPPPEDWKERFDLWKEIALENLALYKAKLQDLFSERQVTLKKVDVTTIALEGAAAGIAVVGFLWVMLNPR